MEDTSFIFSSGPIELKQEGEDFFAEGYIATDDLDLVYDIVTKECMLDMTEQMRERTIKLDIEHESFRGKDNLEREINKTIIPAAKIDDFLMDKKGLKIRAMLNRHTQRFSEVKGSLKDGFLDAFSIAFVPISEKTEIRNGKEVRLLDKINLLNVAFTGNPINTNATIEKVFMKSLDFLKAKPKKPKPQPDPHKEPEEDEDEEDKTGKHPKKKKAYEKDGAHAHTEDEPLGLHNHPEVESMIRNLGDQLNSRINFLSDRLHDSLEDSMEPRALKAKLREEKNHNHVNDTIKLQEVKNMTEEEEKKKLEKEEVAKKVEAEEKAKAEKEAKDEEVAKEAAEKEAAEKEAAEKEEAAKPEGSDTEGKDFEKLKEDMVEVKAALKRPMLKSKVEQVNKAGLNEEKSINPLDVIA